MRVGRHLAWIVAFVGILCSAGQAGAACLEPGGFQITHCTSGGYFETPPLGAGTPSAVFWQVGYGDRTLNSGTGSPSGTGMSGALTFNGNDSGLLVPILVAPGGPTAALCLGTMNWGDPGVDGCCDNPRVVALPLTDDDILNPLYDVYYRRNFVDVIPSDQWVQDSPMAVLLTESTDRWFAVAAVATKLRPSFDDPSPGSFDFSTVVNGLPNALGGTNTNVIPWQIIPGNNFSGNPSYDLIRSDVPVVPSSPAGDHRIMLGWAPIALHSDVSSRPSTSVIGNPGNGMGVLDFGELHRYIVEKQVPQNGVLSPGGWILVLTVQPPSQPTDAIELIVSADACVRIRTMFGTYPQTLSHTVLNCRLGRCGDLGYEVISQPSCLTSSPPCTPTGAEVCDGLDNDCDGEIDEGLNLTPEVCNGLDDDCDGEIDEGFQTSPEVCDGVDNDCDGLTDDLDSDLSEVCNGIDDDCDGSIDEDVPNFPCDTGLPGPCAIGFTNGCDLNGVYICHATISPEPDICFDGIDNDCSGSVDDPPRMFLPCDGDDADECNDDVPVCVNSLSCPPACWDSQTGLACVDVPNDLSEKCDGLDNDCDGTVDEGLPDSDLDGTADCFETCDNDPLKVDPGVCGCGLTDTDSDGDGVPNCNDGCPNDSFKSSPGGCGCGAADTDSDGDGSPDCIDGCDFDPLKTSPGGCGCGIPDAAEVCDGLNNDCDGQTDEDFPTKGQPCDGSDTDMCQNGTYTCTPDGLGTECANETVADIQEVCDGLDNDCNGSIDDAVPVKVETRRSVILGDGSHPPSTNDPLPDVQVGVYYYSSGTCAFNACGGLGIPALKDQVCLGSIVSTCTPFRQGVTDGNGEFVFHLPFNNAFAVVGLNSVDNVFGGKFFRPWNCNEATRPLRLAWIKQKNGKVVVANSTERTGSLLTILEPETIEWTEGQQPYPFIFETEGDWSVTTTVTPPEGFVPDYESLTADVASETEAVQFTLTDVGSDWVPTEVLHDVRHGARHEVVRSRVGVALSPALARQKGLNTAGHVLDAHGKPIPERGFDPRARKPAEVIGWIEPSARDADWTVKVRVNDESAVTVAITRGRGRMVRLIGGGRLQPGDYDLLWDGKDTDGRSLAPGNYHVRVTAGPATDSVRIIQER